jgi:hypothetical protein
MKSLLGQATATVTFTAFFFVSLTSVSLSGGGGGQGAAQSTASQASQTSQAAATTPSGASNPSPASGTAGPANGNVFLKMQNPTLYVLVFAGDPTTTNILAYEVSTLLQPYTIASEAKPKDYKGSDGAVVQALTANMPDYPKLPHVGAWIVPEPGWSLSDYAIQCQNDEETIGAIVLYDIENNSGTSSYFVFQQGYTRLYARAAWVTCDRVEYQVKTPSVKTQGLYPASGVASIAAGATVSGVGPSPSPPVESIRPQPIMSPQTTTQSQNQKTAKCTKSGISNMDPDVLPTPCVTPEVDYQRQATTSSTAPEPTSPPFVASQLTVAKTLIPTMTVVWQNASEISGEKYNGNIPFLTLAALGAYLAARQETVTNATAVSIPNTPGTSANGMTMYSHSEQQNNSTLPFGLALLGTSLGAVGSGNAGGLNAAAMLKFAAAQVATQLAEQLRAVWYNDAKGYCDINRTFDFFQWGPLPQETPEPSTRPYPYEQPPSTKCKVVTPWPGK